MPKLRWICLLLCLLIVPTVLAQSDEILTSGDVVEGELTDDMLEMQYTFSATVGERVTITLESRQFDALLQLEDEDGTGIASNDDSEGSLNSQISNFELNRAGDYTIIVTSSDGSGTGDFTLTFNTAESTVLEYGDRVEGSFDETTDQVLYEFEGTKGDVISISMQGEGIDSFLRLSTDAGELFTDDDSGGSLNALIASYPLPETATYFITATTFSTGAVGDFTLSLNSVTSVEIDLDTPIESTIDGTPMYFTFEVNTGDIISVRVRSEDGLLDTALNVTDSSGFTLGTDDDSGYILDPEINFATINTGGQFTAIVSPNSEDVAGDFTIEVVTQVPTITECGASETISLTSKLPRVSYTLAVDAEQTLSFVVMGEQSDIDSLTFTLSQNDEAIFPDYDFNTEGQVTVSVTTPEQGDLRMVVDSFAFQRQTFDMEIVCE